MEHIRKSIVLVLAFIMASACFAGAGQPAYAAKTKEGGQMIPAAMISPKLARLDYYYKAGKYNAKLTWHSRKGYTYRVYRKKKGAYKAIATRRATGSMTSYVNRDIGRNKGYTYTVKQISPKTLRKYDKEGLTLLSSVSFRVGFGNSYSTIRWKKVPKAQKYCIYRTRDNNNKRRRLAAVKGRSYRDRYSDSVGSLRDILHLNTFVDPAIRDFQYNVRPVYSKRVGTKKKVSKGLMMPCGIFRLEPPVVISLSGNVLRWGTVPNAKHYLLLSRQSSRKKWKVVKRVYAKKRAVTMTAALDAADPNAYYAVQAESDINGRKVMSRIEGGFTLKEADHSDKSILFIGDSIMYGALYKAPENRHLFSTPRRIHQLTGAEFYNPSIPGATYHYQSWQRTNQYRYRIVTDVVEQMKAGKAAKHAGNIVFEKSSGITGDPKIRDFDIVVLAAGTNDYIDDTKMGDITSKDKETFCGSVNCIMKAIKCASKQREKAGRKKIKVVFVDLFYSERCLDKTKRMNRDTTKNGAGYTLADYQNSLNGIYKRWAKTGSLTLYRYKTRSVGIVDHNNITSMTPDNLHFTKYAYALYGDSMAQFLLENVL